MRKGFRYSAQEILENYVQFWRNIMLQEMSIMWQFYQVSQVCNPFFAVQDPIRAQRDRYKASEINNVICCSFKNIKIGGAQFCQFSIDNIIIITILIKFY